MKKIALLFRDILRYIAENRKTMFLQLIGKAIRIYLACGAEPSCIIVNCFIEGLTFFLSVTNGYMEDRRNMRLKRTSEWNSQASATIRTDRIPSTTEGVFLAAFGIVTERIAIARIEEACIPRQIVIVEKLEIGIDRVLPKGRVFSGRSSHTHCQSFRSYAVTGPVRASIPILCIRSVPTGRHCPYHREPDPEFAFAVAFEVWGIVPADPEHTRRRYRNRAP